MLRTEYEAANVLTFAQKHPEFAMLEKKTKYISDDQILHQSQLLLLSYNEKSKISDKAHNIMRINGFCLMYDLQRR